MNLKKRGLGRGLEALLADASGRDPIEKQNLVENNQPTLTENQLQIDASVKLESNELLRQPAMAIALIKNIQRENLLLQEEAAALSNLLEEFEQVLRRS